MIDQLHLARCQRGIVGQQFGFSLKHFFELVEQPGLARLSAGLAAFILPKLRCVGLAITGKKKSRTGYKCLQIPHRHSGGRGVIHDLKRGLQQVVLRRMAVTQRL